MHSQPLSRNEFPTTRRWALLIGVDYYRDTQIAPLNYCTTDASALAELFLSRPDYGYSPERLRVLKSTDRDHDQATRLDILGEFIELTKATEEQDSLLFYFSGHGTVINGEPYLIPSDANSNNLLADTAIPMRRVKDVMKSVAKARSRVIILDACYMGVELRTKSPEEAQETFLRSVRSAFEDAEGIAILASSSRDEPSVEDAKKEHGGFTYYILQAFRDVAANDNQDAYLTLNEVFRYVTERMKQEYPQRPTLEFEGTGEIVLLPAITPLPESDNPIRRTYPVAVREKKDCYDRQDEIKKIKDLLQSTTDLLVVIRGERCVGKTSLINRIKILLSEERWSDRQFIYFAIEPRSFLTVKDLAREIWQGLIQSLRQANIPLPPHIDASFQFEGYSDFAYRLEQISIQAPDVTFVVFIDELDKAKHDIQELDFNQVIGLINHLLVHTKFPLFFIVSLLQDLPPTYESPPPKEKIILRPFNRADTDEMILSLLQNWPQPDIKILSTIYQYAGGNPYFTKLLLHEFFESQSHLPADQWSPAVMHQIIAHAIHNVNALEVFQSIYNEHLTDPERYLLLWLATKENYTIAAHEIPRNKIELRTAAKLLCERDYLIQQSDGSYHLRMALMGEWLKTWTHFELESERLKISGLSEGRPEEGLVTEIVSHGICIDLSTSQVYLEGEKIVEDLSDLQFRALVYLARNAGSVVSREELFTHLYHETYIPSEQGLDALIYRIRSAIRDDQKPPKYLETLRKRGFRMKNVVLVRIRNDGENN